MHNHRLEINDSAYSRYVVWVRDPVDRFESAYDFQRAVILTNTTGMRVMGNHLPCQLSSACLAPGHIKQKLETGHAFQEHFEELMLHFPDANAVGESLSLCSSERESSRKDCRLAQELMLSTTMHINKGVGFYLHGGAFVDKHADRMFVGSQEYMLHDLDRLARWLGTRPSVAMPNVRVNPAHGAMSQQARANIRSFYNLSMIEQVSAIEPGSRRNQVSADYAAMRALVRAGLLAADRYDLS
jgi:hypothetical protein